MADNLMKNLTQLLITLLWQLHAVSPIQSPAFQSKLQALLVRAQIAPAPGQAFSRVESDDLLRRLVNKAQQISFGSLAQTADTGSFGYVFCGHVGIFAFSILSKGV
jgi:hypothetical protein